MVRARLILFVAMAVGLTLAANPSAAPQASTSPTIDQFLGAASPIEVVAAAPGLVAAKSAPRDLPQGLIWDVMSGKTDVIRTIDDRLGIKVSSVLRSAR